MENIKRAYLPPAGSDWALPLYDPITRLTGADAAKRMLLDQAALRPSHRVFDIGCGTGTLALLIKRLYPDVEVVGLDPDPKALTRARKKAARAGVAIQFDQGFSDALPYPEASFDRVFSSFMFHHLCEEDRVKTLRNVCKVLAPGGSLHLLDMERPEADARGWWAGMLRSNPHLKDNSPGRVVELMTEAGFGGAKHIAEGRILFGLVRCAYYQATAS